MKNLSDAARDQNTAAAVAALALLESQRQVGSIFADDPNGYARLNVNGLIAASNTSFNMTMGIAPDRVVGSELRMLAIDEDRAALGALLAYALTGLTGASAPIRVQRPDGSLRWTRINASLVSDDAGKPLWIAVLAQDDTAARLSAWRALEDTQQLRAAVEGARLGTFHWDLVTGRLVTSVTGLAYLGRTAAEIRDFPSLLAVMHPDDRPAVSRAVQDVAQSAGDFNFDCRAVWPNGSIHWLALAGNALADLEGQSTRVEGVIIDIGPRKAAEAKMLRDAGTLASNVTDLRNLNIKLTASTLAAQQATAAKTWFLANMSHEIRTPLNAIVGLTYLLRSDGATPQQVDRLIKIDSASQHLLSVINAILDLAKIEARQMKLESVPVNIAEITTNVVTMVQVRADAKRLRIVADLGPVPDRLIGDPVRLQQALLNYANNAIKFTESGAVNIRVVPVEEDPDSALLRFEVSDSGLGIDAPTLERLFMPFEQGDNSTTRAHGGTGLGLAITMQLAELMGGEAGVSSTPGVGSTFWFTARLRKSEVALPISTTRPADARNLLVQHHAGRRVLLVEDEPINREVASALLASAVQTVDRANDGAEAIRLMAASRYDLVLMDVQLPEMDGLEATRCIRTRAQAAAVPIIALTASAFESDRRACFAAGMNDFLAKPIEPDLLFNTLLKWYPPVANATPSANEAAESCDSTA